MGHDVDFGNLLCMFDESLGKLITHLESGAPEKALMRAKEMRGAIGKLKAHCVGEVHSDDRRLAIDLNLFRDGRYLETTEDHAPLGLFWESLGGTWGGRFRDPDGNHYSLGE